MIRYRGFVVAVAAAVGGFAAAAPLHAQGAAPLVQDVAPPIGLEPADLEISVPAAPMQMRAEDAQRLLEQLGVPLHAPAPQVPLAVAPAKGEGGGVSRTVTVEAPSVVNKSSQFIFRDVTERQEPASPALSAAQRHATVEAYRQSLVKKKEADR